LLFNLHLSICNQKKYPIPAKTSTENCDLTGHFFRQKKLWLICPPLAAGDLPGLELRVKKGEAIIMLDTSTCTLRQMDREELAEVLNWSAAEGWNPGLFDAQAFHAADPHGFFLAEIDGQAAGCIGAVAYDEHFGFIGFFIVPPEFRGGCCGVALARAARDYLGGRTVGLDGVAARQAHYQRLGFEAAYCTIRYGGIPRNPAGSEKGTGSIRMQPWASPEGWSDRSDVADPSPFQVELVPLRHLPFAEVLAYDRQLFPAWRPAFLEAWIQQMGSVALGVVRNNCVAGYAVARLCCFGYKIGPLFADQPTYAEAILQALADTLPEATVSLDIPEPNAAAIELAQRWGLKPSFPTARMYHGTPPRHDLSRIYGVTSLELG
jgi:hypothetical protein